jgi:gluconokinase
LPSQFAILEALQADEPGIEVSIEGSQQEMIDRAIQAVQKHASKEESLVR